MFRVNFILCSVLVMLVMVENVAGHGFGYSRGYGRYRHGGHRHQHHHHRHRHHMPVQISIVVFDPKGLEAYVRRPNDTVQYFALEININKQDGGAPEVSLNTTEVVYGKFMLRDTEVIIKPGDFLNVSWFLGLANGSAVSGNKMLRVYPNMIKRNCTCEADAQSTIQSTRTSNPVSSIPPWFRSTTERVGVPRRTTRTRVTTTEPPTSTVASRSTTLSPSDFYNELENSGSLGDFDASDYLDQFDCEIDPSTNLCRSNLFDVRVGGQPEKFVAKPSRDDEVRALRGIIDSLLSQSCSSQPRSNLLTLANQHYSLDSSIDWLKYVRGTLGDAPKLKSLASSAIRSARAIGDVIVFEMNTQHDKLMMLYLCNEIGMSAVKDYD